MALGIHITAPVPETVPDLVTVASSTDDFVRLWHGSEEMSCTSLSTVGWDAEQARLLGQGDFWASQDWAVASVYAQLRQPMRPGRGKAAVIGFNLSMAIVTELRSGGMLELREDDDDAVRWHFRADCFSILNAALLTGTTTAEFTVDTLDWTG